MVDFSRKDGKMGAMKQALFVALVWVFCLSGVSMFVAIVAAFVTGEDFFFNMSLLFAVSAFITGTIAAHCSKYLI